MKTCFFKNFLVFFAASLLCCSFFLNACGSGSAGTETTPSTEPDVPNIPPEKKGTYEYPATVPVFTAASVHDPSVYYDEANKKYYVFGSHFASASSGDLINWRQETLDGRQNGAKQFFGNANWWDVLTQTADYIYPSGSGRDETNNLWAPDVIKKGNDYYMYFSFSTFGSSKSIIARAKSQNLMGPYAEDAVLVKSPADSKHGGDKPNAIDPELFYDKDGGLWMVYGSFFGGIYVKELNKDGDNFGLAKDAGDEAWGSRVCLGASGGPEGPFIFYDKVRDYYYLIVSYGSLSSDYNMRIGRSKNPAGPYLDVAARDLASKNGYGNKLAGNFQFAGEEAVAALGHNSVCEKNGEFFVIAHARTEDGANTNNVTLGHSLRTYRLLFNEDDWPVLSTERYAGEKLGKILSEEVAGSYDLVLHSEGNVKEFVRSEKYIFSAGGKIIKNADKLEVGAWEFTEDTGTDAKNYIKITLGTEEYKGVVAPVYSKALGNTLGISAVSKNARPLFSNKFSSFCDAETQNPLPLEIAKKGAAVAKDTEIPALGQSVIKDGVSLSFSLDEKYLTDWSMVFVLQNGNIGLPNLHHKEAGAWKANLWAGGDGLFNSANATTFNKNACFVTISLNANGTMSFYKDGESVVTYKASDGTNTYYGAVAAFPAFATWMQNILSDFATTGATVHPSDAWAAGVTTELPAASDYTMSGLYIDNAVDDDGAKTIYNERK